MPHKREERQLAGRKGGMATRKKHGAKHYATIGKLGGLKAAETRRKKITK